MVGADARRGGVQLIGGLTKPWKRRQAQ